MNDPFQYFRVPSVRTGLWTNRVIRQCRMLASTFAACLLCALPFAFVASGLAVEPPVESSLPESTRIRVLRRFVGPELLRDVTAGHVPVKAAELESLLQANLSNALAQPTVTAVDYSATFADGQLAKGKLVADIDNRRHKNAAARLSLRGCALGLAVPQSNAAAETGVSLGNDSDGQPVMFVRGNRLDLDWGLANQTPESTVARFHFAGIACPFNRLTIDIAADLQLTSQYGIVRRDPIQPAPAMYRWTVELGGRHETKLEIRSAKASRVLQPVVVEQQVTRHLLSTQGAEVEAELSLSSAEPLTNVTILASSSLGIARVVMDSQEAEVIPIAALRNMGKSSPRSNEPSAGSSDRVPSLQRYGVRFLKPINRGTLQVFAQSDDIPRGPLPQIFLLDAFWQSRRVEAVVPDHLALTKIDLDHYRWVEASRDENTNSRRLAWQALSSEGNVALWSEAARARISAEIVSRVELEPQQTSGMAQVELVGQSGPAYEISGTIGSGWTVTSVATEPATALDDWQLQSDESDSTKLKIRFATPLTNGRRLGIQIFAQRRTIRHGALVSGKIGDVFMPENVRVARYVQAFATIAPLRLDVDDDDHVTPLDPAELATLVGDVGKVDYAYIAVDGDSEPKFRLRRGSVPWSAGILVHNLLRNGRCDERWEVNCIPSADGLSEVVVQVAPASETDAMWFSDRDRSVPLVAERVVEQEPEITDAAGVVTERDTYRITLPADVSECTIYGARSRSLAFDEHGRLQSTAMAIVTAPTAKSHGAIVTLGVDNLLSERIQSIESSLESVSFLLPDRQLNTVAAFRYDANAEFKLPSIQFHRESTPVELPRSLAWIEEAVTTTRIGASGDSWHTLELTIQNRGRRSMALTLPVRYTVRRVVLNDQPLATQVVDAGELSQELQIPLPLNRQTHLAIVEFQASKNDRASHETTEQLDQHQTPNRRSWTAIRRLRKPQWETAVPVYTDEWRVELKQRYASFPSLDSAMGSFGARIFGPLGRSEDLHGNSMVEPAVPVSGTQTLTLFPRRLVKVLGWVFGLLVLGIVWADVVGHRSLVFYLGASLALAAAAPPPMFVLGTAATWGIVLGTLLRWLPDPGAFRLLAPHASRGATQLSMLLFAVLIICVSPTRADESSNSNRLVTQQSSASLDTIHLVVPLGSSDSFGSQDKLSAKNERSLPSVVYLPTHEYEQLIRSAQRRATTAPGNLISDVHYFVKLERTSKQLPAECSEVEVEFTIATPQSAESVDIALAAGARDRLLGSPRLDGDEFQPVWNRIGDRLTVPLQKRQMHKLTLRFAPIVGNRENWLSLWLPIVPHPAARLTVNWSVDEGVQVRVPSARGVVTTGDNDGVVTAQLGLSDGLDVRWRSTEQSNALAATQWLHANIAPGQVELKMRVVDELTGQPIRQLRMRVPAEMTWVPPDGAIVSGRVEDQSSTELTVEWFETAGKRDQMTFLSRESLVDGNVRVNVPELLNVELTNRQLAMQVDSNYVLVQDGAAGKLGLDAFEVAWPTAPRADFLQRLVPNQNVVELEVLPRTSRQVADQSTDVTFFHDRVSIAFQADIVPLQGQSFQHVVELPAGVIVDKVGISNGPRASWTQDDNQVCLLPEQPIGSPHQLSMTAHLPVDPAGEIAMPVPQLASASVGDTTVTVFSGDQVDVQLSNMGSFSPVPDTSTGFRTLGDEKKVATLRSSNKDLAMPAVRVAQKSPVIIAKMLITMQAVSNNWRSQVDLVIQSDDALDSIGFEIPENWGEDLTISPAARWSITQLPDRRRRLKVWLPLNISAGERTVQRLSLSALVDTAQGVRLPRIRPMLVRELTAWVQLPDSIGDRSLDWATRRLVQQTLPKEFQDDAKKVNLESYRAIGRTANAILRTTKRETDQPECKLTLGQLVVRDSTCQQTYRFYLNPNGHGKLAIRLPSGLELTAASVAGRNGQLRRLSSHTWELEHLPPNLPYRLDLHCVRQIDDGTEKLSESCPELIGVRSSRTLWHVASKRLHTRSVTIDGTTRLSRFKVLNWKCDQLLGLVELPPESASLATQAETVAWNRLWVSQLEEDFGTQLSGGPIVDSVFTEAATQSAKEWLQEFQVNAENRLAQDRSVDFDDTADLTSAAGIGGKDVVIRLVAKPRTSSTRSTFVLLAIMLPLWLGRPFVWESSRIYVPRWLPTICVAVGVVWWIWLKPAWFGLIVASFAAIFSLQSLVCRRMP